LESGYAAAGVYQNANVRDDPVYVSLCAPPVPKQPNGHEETASKHERQSKLGSANSIVLLLEVAIDTIVEESRYLGSNDWAEAKRDVVQAGHAARLVVLVNTKV